MNPTSLIDFSDWYHALITVSLWNAVIFYVVTIFVFVVASKTRMNYALAVQKFFWLMLVLFMALPNYVDALPRFPPVLRVITWVGLTLSTWGVLYEVYRENWNGSLLGFLRYARAETRYFFGHFLPRRLPYLIRCHIDSRKDCE